MGSNSLRQMVLDVYDLKKPKKEGFDKNKNNRDGAAQYAKYHLNKVFPGRKWDDLTELEQETYVYVTIREAIIQKYVPANREKSLRIELDQHVQEVMLSSQIAIRDHNAKVEALYKRYDLHTMTESDKKEAYESFSNELTQIDPKCPIPSYDEWIADNQKHPMRIYDYIMSYEQSIDVSTRSSDGSEKYVPSDKEIDHVAFQTLLSILPELLRIKIDIPAIEECLTFTRNYEVDLNEPLLLEYDPELAISEEEQRENISNNLKYTQLKKKLDNLDFIIDLDN